MTFQLMFFGIQALRSQKCTHLADKSGHKLFLLEELFEDVWSWNGTDFKIIEKCLSKVVGEFIEIPISNRKQKILPQEREL